MNNRPTHVLAEGTVDEVMAQGGDSPAHFWPEARNPANQWLANLKGRQRAAQEVYQAGLEAKRIVRAGFRRAGYPIPGEDLLP